jgi:uncharacterized protein (TIGR02466 family)
MIGRGEPMKVVSLFPKAVGTFQLGRDLTDSEIKFIKGQPTRPNTGNTTSVDNYILKAKKLKDINKFIEASVNEYFQTVYEPKNNIKLRITQSWCNYTEPGGFHHKHAHPNSFISGVFYPQANKDTDKIYFHKDGYEQILVPSENWNVWNSVSWWLEAEQGGLYIFPSSLTHVVDTVNGTQTRISLSFNTFPVGMIGVEEDLTGLLL